MSLNCLVCGEHGKAHQPNYKAEACPLSQALARAESAESECDRYRTELRSTVDECYSIGKTIARMLNGERLPSGGSGELLAAIQGALGLSLTSSYEEIVSKYSEIEEKSVARERDFYRAVLVKITETSFITSLDIRSIARRALEGEK